MTRETYAFIDQIPKHLHSYIVDQNYEDYTAEDHAVWRYIMRVNRYFLKDTAHESYLEGLEKTGIDTEKIPNIYQMNKALAKIGWKAVVVDGFLPPAIFMEFQKHKILVISADMRTIQHLLYTPAPDIVHEAAGHAPIIADTAYADYLQKFGAYGMKAFSSKLDNDIYEAIRYLSIIKEYPETSVEELEKAEADLNAKLKLNTNPSEMTRLSRLHWWTVEYGLIGTPEKHKIYGAGLLSSVSESNNCLKPQVKKIPLSVDAANVDYDITREQPQLFVNNSWEHLHSVLESFVDTLAFRKGGQEALQIAIDSETVATAVFSSGMQVSGLITQQYIANGNVAYINTMGETSLAVGNAMLNGHSPEYHKEGFGSPVGTVFGGKKLEAFDADLCALHGIVKGEIATIEYDSGIKVCGSVEEILRIEGSLVLVTFSACTVKDEKGNFLFRPEWGMYDMAVGSEITSVFCGTADREKHVIYPQKSERNAIPITYNDAEKRKHEIYSSLRRVREENLNNEQEILTLFEIITATYKKEWLLNLELLEILKVKKVFEEKIAIVEENLNICKKQSEESRALIERGLTLLV